MPKSGKTRTYKKRIPRTNNAGEKPENSVQRILSVRKFTFQGTIVRRALGDHFKKFVEKYVESRKHGSGSYWEPSPKELQVFALFKRGRVDIDGFIRALDIKNKQSAFQKLGRLYEFKNKKIKQ